MSELHDACFDGSLPRVKQALAAGAVLDEVNERGHTAFYVAAVNGRISIMTLLADNGADVNAQDARGATPLFARVKFDCDLTATEFLLDRGASIDLATRDGWTPLMAACTWDARWNPVAKLLIERGADLDHRSHDGWTPLVLACAEGVWVQRGVDSILIESGADVNRAGCSGWTPLMMAVRFALPGVVRDLLAHGADVDAPMVVDVAAKPITDLARRFHTKLKRTGAGYTALLWAAHAGKLPMVKILAEAGASFAAKSKNGDTVTSLAKGARLNKYLAGR
jgi:ankyrin repeat protein